MSQQRGKITEYSLSQRKEIDKLYDFKESKFKNDKATRYPQFAEIGRNVHGKINWYLVVRTSILQVTLKNTTRRHGNSILNWEFFFLRILRCIEGPPAEEIETEYRSRTLSHLKQ